MFHVKHRPGTAGNTADPIIGGLTEEGFQTV